MWIWIFRIASLAGSINARRPFILFILTLLRQFDRSLAKADSNERSRRVRSAGFVYVIRDTANGQRFKTGYRAKPPWRDSQLRRDLGESGDFVLVIPAKNAGALEKKLRQAYGRGIRRGAWFTLSEGKRREILIIAALVQAVTGNDLGMAEVEPEIVQVATDLLRQLEGLASKLWTARRRSSRQPDHAGETSEYEPDLDNFAAIPEMDWEWESVLDENYRDLPKARGQSGYITIIRDNDAKLGKIFFDNHPLESIKAALTEKWRQFALEVVLVLKVDNIKKAAESLLSQSERNQGTEWIDLTQEELGEINQSARQERTHGSLYVSPRSFWGLKILDAGQYRGFLRLEKPSGYVCVVQGVNPGSLYKIWETSYPKGLVEDRWQSRELNNLHDMLTARKPIKFHVILECKYAESFREFLQERYHIQRRHNGWFELSNAQLEDISRMGQARS